MLLDFSTAFTRDIAFDHKGSSLLHTHGVSQPGYPFEGGVAFSDFSSEVSASGLGKTMFQHVPARMLTEQGLLEKVAEGDTIIENRQDVVNSLLLSHRLPWAYEGKYENIYCKMLK